VSADEPEVVVHVCGARDASPEALEALAELARAAVRAVELERAAMTPAQRAELDARRARLERIRRRARLDERGEP
jgi:hypothetical protein